MVMHTAEELRAALAEHPIPDNPWVKVTPQGIVIYAGYSETLQRMLRWVPHTQWRSDLRAWVVPLAGLAMVRSVLPEISRLAEAMQEERSAPSDDRPAPHESRDEARARSLFRDAARLLYGSDWQRDTAHALQRNEAALACWLVGEGVAEAPPAQLLQEMLALMRSRAAQIQAAADDFAAHITPGS
jgi:hypothetical protein